MLRIVFAVCVPSVVAGCLALMAWNKGWKKWSTKQWDQWRPSQNWSPDRRPTKAMKAKQFDEEVTERAQVIMRDLQNLGANPAAATARSLSDQFDRVADLIEHKRRNSKRLKAALAYRETLAVEDDPLLTAQLDEEIRACRRVARGEVPTARATEELAKSLAVAQARLSRAETHFQGAQCRRDALRGDVTHLQSQLLELP